MVGGGVPNIYNKIDFKEEEEEDPVRECDDKIRERIKKVKSKEEEEEEEDKKTFCVSTTQVFFPSHRHTKTTLTRRLWRL